MESIETKEMSTGPEEPIKSEVIVPSSETSGRNNGASSPPPHCSICLEQLINTSFTDSCLHQFCFTCLLQWSKIKTECPLCKQTFKSIIHNVRSEGDYDQYHVQYSSQVSATLDVAADIQFSRRWDVAVGAITMPVCPFMYRTTLGARGRYGVLLNSQAVARHEQLPSISHQVSSEERRRRTNNPIDYRRTIYRHGRYAYPLPDAFGRLRTSNAEYYRRNPAEIDRLIPFLNRELQVLLNNNRPHISYVMRVITDVLPQYDITSEQFGDLIRPYFGIHTAHFVHEFSNYANSNFDLIGYDQAVTYNSNRGLSNEYVPRAVSPSSSSTTSTDSDVRIVNDSLDSYRYYHMPSVGPHLIDMPGPSTVSQAFRMNSTPYTVLTISSTSSESENDCEVVGYVKPRHERTPEVIDLSSSEPENNPSQPILDENIEAEVVIEMKEENLPSTSSSCDNSNKRTRRLADDLLKAQMFEYFNSISESNSDEFDSDYTPSRSKSRRHKNSSKKASKVTPRKLRTRSRKKSVSSQRKRDKERRVRLSSCDSDESPQREVLPNSRGTKRYRPKSSEESEPEKRTKKSKKSKKAKKSSKKSKKRSSVTTLLSKTVCYNSDSCSSSCSDFEEDKNKTSKRKSKKNSKAVNLYRYSSEERPANDKSTKNSSSRKSKQKTCNTKYDNDSDSSEYEKHEFSRNSSSASFESHKLINRLDIGELNRHCLEKEDNRSQSSSIFSDEASSSCLKGKSSVNSATATSTNATTSQSSDTFSSMSATSSKSDVSSPTENSETKATKDRYRSHKKHKESKKRRRSRS